MLDQFCLVNGFWGILIFSSILELCFILLRKASFCDRYLFCDVSSISDLATEVSERLIKDREIKFATFWKLRIYLHALFNLIHSSDVDFLFIFIFWLYLLFDNFILPSRWVVIIAVRGIKFKFFVHRAFIRFWTCCVKRFIIWLFIFSFRFSFHVFWIYLQNLDIFVFTEEINP